MMPIAFVAAAAFLPFYLQYRAAAALHRKVIDLTFETLDLLDEIDALDDIHVVDEVIR